MPRIPRTFLEIGMGSVDEMREHPVVCHANVELEALHKVSAQRVQPEVLGGCNVR